jgi:plastocyanin
MPRPPLAVLACFALAAGGVIAGCGSSSDSSTTKSTATAPPAVSTRTTAAKASSGAVVNVNMKDIKFVPANITVKVGQKIHWTNTDTPPHTVTATSGATFDSGNINPGSTFDYTPTKAGTIQYICTIHNGQTGTITVTK